MNAVLMPAMQAGLEYAVRSGAAAAKESSLPPIAGCTLDRTFVSCLNHAHPVATVVIGLGLAAILFNFIARR